MRTGRFELIDLSTCSEPCEACGVEAMVRLVYTIDGRDRMTVTRLFGCRHCGETVR